MAFYNDGKHDDGNFATLSTKPKKKKYWVLIDSFGHIETIKKPISDIRNPFPELAELIKDRSILDDFKDEDWVDIWFYDTKKERDEAAEMDPVPDGCGQTMSGKDFVAKIMDPVPVPEEDKGLYAIVYCNTCGPLRIGPYRTEEKRLDGIKYAHKEPGTIILLLDRFAKIGELHINE